MQIQFLPSQLFVTFLFSLVSLYASAQENPKYSKEIEDKIKQVENNLSGWVKIQDSTNTWSLQDQMKSYKIHGLSIAVVHNYKIEWARGYGWADSGEQRPVTVQTLFQAASISKSLNGVGVVKLVQDKKLDLYTDINNYLATWKFPYDSLSKNKKINTAQLLSHTAGLTIHGFPGYEKGDSIPTIAQILDGKRPANTKAVRSMYEPGLKSEYSGGGITISQLIVMDITHQPYDAYMWDNVLKPMGMTSSFYTQPPPEKKQALLATGYRGNGNEIKGKYHVYPEQAAAGLWTNPTDLCRYIIETQLSFEGKSNKPLSQKYTVLRLTPYVDSSAALGVFIGPKEPVKYFQHGGANEGFRCQYYGSLEGGDGIAVMVNSDNGGILQQVVNSVATVYQWKDFYKPVMKKLAKISDSLINFYSGDYLLGNDTLTIAGKGNETFLLINRGQSYRIYFSSPEDFFAKEISIDFKFEKDEQGKVKDIYFKQDSDETRAKRL